MENIIISAIVILAVGSACRYLWKAKKQGKTCIGCSCSGTGSCNCSK